MRKALKEYMKGFKGMNDDQLRMIKVTWLTGAMAALLTQAVQSYEKVKDELEQLVRETYDI